MRQVTAIALLLLGRLRRRLIPLAVLALTACLLGSTAGRVLAQADTPVRLVLVIASEGEGDKSAVSLANWLSSLEGLAYCTVQAASQDEAKAMLDRGEAAAVLLLPEGFLASVQTGENKPPTLLTNPARPMEGWIAGWLGETAARILSTAQAGIYAVLAIYDTLPDPGLARETVVLGVNLRYLRAALARTELVEVETVQATGPLAVADHYTLSTLICLLLLLAPFLYPLYGGENLEPFLRRSRAIGVPALLPAGTGGLEPSVLDVRRFGRPLGLSGAGGMAVLGGRRSIIDRALSVAGSLEEAMKR